MKNKIFLFLILGIFLFSFVSADNQYSIPNMGTAAQGDNISISQNCPSASYYLLDSIVLPNRTTISINTNMTFIGGYTFEYFYVVEDVGRYDFNFVTDGCEIWTHTTLEVTPSGSPFTESLSLPVFLPMIIMFLLAIFFFFLTHYVEKEEYKWTFLILGGIFFVFALSYGIVASREVLYGFPLLYAFINGFYKVFIVLLRVLAILIPIVVMFFVIRRAFSSRGYDVGGFKK